MNKIALLTIVIFALLLPTISKAQSYIAHYTYPDKIKKDTLTDTINNIKFIVDKERIYITAIDKSGKQLWKTDPAVDSKLEEYRVKRPTIVYFKLVLDKSGKNIAIEIAYNNSQSGYLDEKSGKFTFIGQD
jgi:hypothetical protein